MIESRPDCSVGWFGKIPAKGDFLRGGVQGPAELSFASWLASSVEHAEGVLPTAPIRFLVASPNESTLVGTWISSHDSVGRDFPISVSRRIPQDVANARWSLLVSYYDAFLNEAEHVLARCFEHGAEELERALNQLSTPHTSELPALLGATRQVLSDEHVRPFADRNFVPADDDPLPYALCTLQRAVTLDEPELTLDIPASGTRDVLVWLELLSALLKQEQQPVVLVWSPAARRMLVGLRAAPIQLLSYLNRPQHRGNRRWPLWTDSTEAAASSCSQIEPSVLCALRENATLAELIELLRVA